MTQINKLKIGLALNAIAMLSDEFTYDRIKDRLKEIEQIVADEPDTDDPEGGSMSNEDVLNDMLRKTFPNVIFIRSINWENKTQAIHFSEEWLNKEYKVESEES